MAFTSKDVMELRGRTGVGMMDCKKALVATDGDMEAAIDYLREKGIATAAKKESRIAAEGIVFSASKNGKSVLLEVNCESDFVAGGPVFREYVAQVADYILDNDTATVEEVITAMTPVTNEYVMKMGEKLSIRRFTVFAENDSKSNCRNGKTDCHHINRTDIIQTVFYNHKSKAPDCSCNNKSDTRQKVYYFFFHKNQIKK